MAKSIPALVKPELLIWARRSAHMKKDFAAKKLGIETERLSEWESGQKAPTLNQLRNIARVYRQNFAAFFLPKPPEVFEPEGDDYRRMAGHTHAGLHPDVAMDMRAHINARDIALELEKESQEQPQYFDLSCTLQDDPKEVADLLRSKLGVTWEQQRKLKEHRLGFNFWREKIENTGCIVFQTKSVPLEYMRGYAIYQERKPVIVINRKDSQAARIFTLLHEFAHLLLQRAGICDLETDSKLQLPPEIQYVEQFCNRVAALTLVPDNLLMNTQACQSGLRDEWDRDTISKLAKDFCVSHEVLLRRLLDLNLATRSFYEKMRRFYNATSASKKKGAGGPQMHIDVVSLKGRPFTKTVLNALEAGLITITDASDHLGLKSKHFSNLENYLSPKTT